MLQTVFLTVVNMSITASLVILAVLLGRLLLRRAPKVFSYALWAVVLFRLLCPISLTAGFSLFNLGRGAAQGTGPVGSMEYVSFPVEDAADPPPAVLEPDDSPAAAGPSWERAGTEGGVAAFLLTAGSVLWLLGAAGMLLVNAVQLGRLRSKLICSVPLRKNIYLADHIPTPFVMGLLHPRIYLPSSLTEAEQANVIPHEEHHIRRGDPVIKLLAFGALCLHWFNPLVWLSFALASKDMEMSCDEAVIKQSGGEIRAAYSLSLLQFSAEKRLFTGTPLAFGEGDTKERIKNVMRYKKPTAWMVGLALVVCLVLTACLSSNPQPEEEPSDSASDTADGQQSETAAPEQTAEFTGRIAGIDREANGLSVKTGERYGFSQADTVKVYLPSDADTSRWAEGSWVKIAYTGAPETAEADNGEEGDTAVLPAEQVLGLRDYLTWGEDATGTLSETVGFGEYWVKVLVQFTYDPYEMDGAGYRIRDIVSARAENLSGWLSVQSDVEIDAQNIIYAKDRQEAIVPLTYYASIGEGLAEYTGTVSIDLSAFAPVL